MFLCVIERDVDDEIELVAKTCCGVAIFVYTIDAFLSKLLRLFNMDFSTEYQNQIRNRYSLHAGRCDCL